MWSACPRFSLSMYLLSTSWSNAWLEEHAVRWLGVEMEQRAHDPWFPGLHSSLPTLRSLVFRPNPVTTGDLQVLAFARYKWAICLGLGFDCKVIWPVPSWNCDLIHQEFSVFILGGWKAIDFKDAFYPRKNLKQESKSAKVKKEKKNQCYVCH